MSITTFPTGDLTYYSSHGDALNKTTPDGGIQNLLPTSVIPINVEMDQITPYLSPLENYKRWMQYSNESPYKIQMQREQSRNQFGSELEVINISDADQDFIVRNKYFLCHQKLFLKVKDAKDEIFLQFSGGHIDMETSSGYRTTLLMEHGNRDPDAEKHEEWLERVIEGTTTLHGCNSPAILFICNVTEDDAIIIARESKRPIICSPHIVLAPINLEGDCIATTQENQGFYTVYPNGTIEYYGNSIFLSRSPRVDSTLNSYGIDFEEEQGDVPELEPHSVSAQVHHPPFDVKAYLQGITQQLLQQQQEHANLQQQQQQQQQGAIGYAPPLQSGVQSPSRRGLRF